MRAVLLTTLLGLVSAQQTNVCLYENCELKATPYYGGFNSVPSVEHCKNKCISTEGCVNFVWGDFGGCYMYGDKADSSSGYEQVVCVDTTFRSAKYVSGSLGCNNAAEVREIDENPVGKDTFLAPDFAPTATAAELEAAVSETKRQLQTTDCFLQKTEVSSDPYYGNKPAATAAACQALCQQTAGCAWFVWGNWSGGQCYLKGPNNVKYIDQSANGSLFISGPKSCPTTTTTTKPATTTTKPTPTTCPTDAVYTQLNNAAQGMTISKRGSSTWADDSSIANYAIQPLPQPCAVVYCRSETDVQATVKWLKANNLKFVIRSGRNDYSGFSTLQDGIILDVSKLTNMRIDTTKNQAVVGAGVRNAEFYNFLGSKGYVSSGGTGATVGLSGCATGGCFGFLTRTYGIVSDLIVGGRIVLSDGTAKDMDSNVLFAIRGAGHNNYGVITEFRFNLIPDGKVYTSITKTWDKSQSRATRVSVIKSWQGWQKNSDKRVNSRLVVLSGGTIQVQTVCTTNDATCRSLCPSLLVSGAGGTNFANFQDFWTSMASYQCNGVSDCLRVARIPPNQWQQNAWRAGSVFSGKQMSDTLINNILQQFESYTSPDGNMYKTYIQFWPDGGQMSAYATTYAAYPWRNKLFHTQLYTSWTGTARPADYNTRMQLMDNVTKMMEAELGSDRYVNYNYKYPNESQQQISQRYYGSNLSKLQTLDKQYDPNGLFVYPQGVLPN
eukprot:GDKI01003518.1.p1 GENE.GDKI01003518.1~~GDKI01003518.1.p1  ORF type:complete len:723 (-),score=182.38 GDKI01003518.1:285-2453(-)